jgi:hypothetical protein
MTVHPMQLPPRSTPSHRLITAAIVLVIGFLSLWLLIAAGLQAARPGDSSVPSLLPEGPAVVDAQGSAPGEGAAELVPLPGPDLAPTDIGLTPR